jgi:16S rRNA (adenine1518-N6/adenine1519-N6)-dimethyltransferase
MINYDSPNAIKAFLHERGFAAQKKFGQNFLINGSARKKIVDELDINAGDEVWEVGPGLGSLSALVLKRGALLRAFEIDKGFCKILTELFAGNANFNLVEGDVLAMWKKIGYGVWGMGYGKDVGSPISGTTEKSTDSKRDLRSEAPNPIPQTPYPNEVTPNPKPQTLNPKFLGNLPNNIGARLLGDFAQNNFLFSRMVVTVQREVAQRIAAKPGTKDYSSISVLLSHYYDIKLLTVLKSESFFPAPNVESQSVRLVLKAETAETNPLFAPIVRALFASRRKTVKNNLTSFLASYGAASRGGAPDAVSILRECGIPENERAENLAAADFLRLARDVAKNI